MNPQIRYYQVVAFLAFPELIVCRAALIGSTVPLSADDFPRARALERFVLKYNPRGFEVKVPAQNRGDLYRHRELLAASEKAGAWLSRKCERIAPAKVAPGVISIMMPLCEVPIFRAFAALQGRS